MLEMGGAVVTKNDLKAWVLDALIALGGSGRIAQIARHIWQHHEKELQASGDLFFTWQYAMRWAGQELQKERKLSKAGKNYTWYLTP
jgi:hypothetical protein